MLKKQLEFITETVGWIGVLLIIFDYALLSFGFVSSQSFWYHGLNFFGGIGIIVDALADKDYQPMVLNLIWMAIALYAIVSIIF
ncbi:MAG: hypothetical protein UT30_C0001G0010 [Candidatus Uhrbacteria bacterium GW2011_GWF2_39_13]|uniref:CBU-0592-like domain-containing protein n=1 Tax=Candidatus Uhrbacteria bacterium GW2011_GWF2_39_13 TaxID=1618995 RepID=A0A0G0MX74_9BACT|nr:MAG: hypothetical protein UT30_C0001G0010 [Candidatus Uhrbacteria bacterium GW2011_GWF2_39_13]